MRNYILNILVRIALVWVIIALSFDTYMLYLNFSGNEKKVKKINSYISSKIDELS